MKISSVILRLVLPPAKKSNASGTNTIYVQTTFPLFRLSIKLLSIAKQMKIWEEFWQLRPGFQQEIFLKHQEIHNALIFKCLSKIILNVQQ
ncbi:MAG: hypothetical protein K9J37_05470 [Saprospiraceae bacterium]|nr:hypothetical protein [Saprospiraceae bacterium]MCF8249339.1 hypothetical protein [Saprospiraceae bacterium]MCF8311384.1 hypothetical protein [Saprospiraceae bacterium]MCF8439958.1 hypothetical protein [Saprospiraceae bacterium]